MFLMNLDNYIIFLAHINWTSKDSYSSFTSSFQSYTVSSFHTYILLFIKLSGSTLDDTKYTQILTYKKKTREFVITTHFWLLWLNFVKCSLLLIPIMDPTLECTTNTIAWAWMKLDSIYPIFNMIFYTENWQFKHLPLLLYMEF